MSSDKTICIYLRLIQYIIHHCSSAINLYSFLGENATITCKVESVPRSRIRWYSMEGSTEVLNNSITNRGQQR